MTPNCATCVHRRKPSGDWHLCDATGKTALTRHFTGRTNEPYLERCEQNGWYRASDQSNAALDKIIAAVRAYLPPDGMTKDEFISTVIEAVDNPEFNKAKEAGRA